MQLVNTINFPFESQLSIAHKVRGLADTFSQEFTRIWDRLRRTLPETADLAPHAARAPIGLPGYYGGAYDRLRASIPMVSCVECIAADPFPQAPTSHRSIEHASRPDGEEDPSFAVLRADLIMPAMMM